MINIRLKQDFINRYKNNYPLLLKEAIVNISKINEGDIVNLTDDKNNFLAKAYIANQNKGFGWVLSFKKDEKIDTTFFYQKLIKAFEIRKDYFKNNDTTAFRVFNGEGDGIGGLSIDYFEEYYLFTWYSLGIYKFKEDIFKAFKQIKKIKGIYEKKRFNTKGSYLDSSGDFVSGEKAPAPLIIKENGVNFAIYLDDGAMVGLFLDQKDVRKTIMQKYSKNRTILNTFSYTGAFSVVGAIGGAKKTTSIDLAKRSLPKTQEQFLINNISLKNQEIIVEDIFHYIKYAIRKNIKYDLVISDPPSFARNKKHTFSASKDYVNLLKQLILLTNKNGIIVASTNSASFSMMVFNDFILKAFKESKTRYKIQESFSLPSDFNISSSFKEGDYLKIIFIKKLS